MNTAHAPCPPPQGCIDELLDLVEEFAPKNPDASVGDFKVWLHGVREDEDGLAVLERARRSGADLRRLLLAAALYLGWRSCLEGALSRVGIGPIHLSPERARDIDEAIAQATALEEAMSRSPDLSSELHLMKELLEPLEEEVRRAQGQPQTYFVPNGRGGFKQKKVILKGAGVAVTTATIGPGAPALQRSRGDAALDVLLLVVMGHLRQVSGDEQIAQAAELVTRGLKIGVSGESGGPSDAVAAARARAYRCREHASKADHRERATFVARMIGLSFRLD